MAASALAPDAETFMRRCLLDWEHGRETVERTLNTRARGWRSVDEWRISTETHESIVHRRSAFEVASACDATWHAIAPSVDDALKARSSAGA